jgi:hypothetical protein
MIRMRKWNATTFSCSFQSRSCYIVAGEVSAQSLDQQWGTDEAMNSWEVEGSGEEKIFEGSLEADLLK